MKRVVIADDDEVARAFITVKMRQSGFVVTAVNDGPAALLAVAQTKPDLVILDVVMRGLDGLEVLKRLKANADTKAVPVVLMSARHDRATVEQAKALGASDYIIKHFLSEDVISHLRKLMAGGATDAV